MVQQDEEQEDHHGDIELLWQYTSDQVEDDTWFIGQLEVRAHTYLDVPQNYSVNKQMTGTVICSITVYCLSAEACGGA